jgi:hypothetical protein
VLALALVACRSDAEVAATMEAALVSANDAVAVSLVSAEPRSWAFVPPSDQLRHGTACGCPCRVRYGEPPAYLLSLDYHAEGCIPDSGLLAVGVSGAAVVEVAGDAVDVTLDGAFLTEAPLAGRLTGGADHAEGALSVGDRAFRLDVDVILDEEIAIDGVVRIGGEAVVLRGLRIARPDLAGDCPAPSAGTAEIGDVFIDFGDPGNGEVTARFRKRESTSTAFCAFGSALL